MHVALYRKYRSQTFSDVCGQDHITATLKYQSMTGRVSHAYLFCGSRGTGKTSCAKILAKAVNCEDPRDGEPCGVCEACRSIDRGTATDVVEMDAASETGVDYIRSIKEEVQYPPALLKKRVYIIDEVHMLSDSAFNALLKTLEEPPEHVIFILATTELYKLPATVVSRCQRFDFRRLPIDVITKRLRYIADSEGITLEDPAAEVIAKQAQGGMRDAISLLDLCSGGGAAVTLERVKDIIGVSGYEATAKAARAVSERDAAALFDIVSEVSVSKDVGVFWRELSSFYRDMLVCKYARDPKSYLDLTETEFAILKECASLFNLAKLHYQSKVLDNALRDMNRMPELKRMIAEFALVRMCDETLDTSPDALAARIEAIERRLSSGDAVTAPKAEREAKPVEDKPEAKAETVVKANAEKTVEKVTATAAENKKEDIAPEKVIKEEPGARPLAPGTKAYEDARYKKVPDLSGVAEEMGKSDFLARALISEATALLRDDGQILRFVTDNPFAETYLDRERKKTISDALIKLKINDRPCQIEIVIKPKGGEPLYEDLFRKIDEQ